MCKIEFNEDLASIHGYLCADGYVIKNLETQKHKYYRIGLRNTNLSLLKDFQEKFMRYFGIKPHISKRVNYERCQIGSKEIYHFLTDAQSYYSADWVLPELKKKELASWLRSYYDCDGWVYNQYAKNRYMGLESVNEKGLLQIKKALFRFGILSTDVVKRKGREIFRLSIFGLDNIKKFNKFIGFNHPKKKKKLNQAIISYVNYNWNIPNDRRGFNKFIKRKSRISKNRDITRFYSIKRKNLIKLQNGLKKYGIKSKICGPWVNNHGSRNYYLEIRMVLRGV